MYLFILFLALAFICVPATAGDLSVSVGFPSAPESQGCGRGGTTNRSASCVATVGDSQGTALASMYQVEPNSYVVLGALQLTQPDDSLTTVKSSVTVQMTEFEKLDAIQGVRLRNHCRADCESIHVYVDGFETSTLGPNACYEVPFQGTPLNIALYAVKYSTTPGTDYLGLINVSATVF
jgi:hypothetical protein